MRDRYLMSHALGRALVARYYDLSPALAAEVRERPWLASAVRTLLAPIVSLADWLVR